MCVNDRSKCTIEAMLTSSEMVNPDDQSQSTAIEPPQRLGEAGIGRPLGEPFEIPIPIRSDEDRKVHLQIKTHVITLITSSEMVNPDDQSQSAAIEPPQRLGEAGIGRPQGEPFEIPIPIQSDEDRKVHLLIKTHVITLILDDDDDGSNDEPCFSEAVEESGIDCNRQWVI